MAFTSDSGKDWKVMSNDACRAPITSRHAQEGGWAEEAHFHTTPLPGPGAAVRLLALADQGWGEYDNSFNFPGADPNPITLQPPGTDAEIKAEVTPVPWASALTHISVKSVLKGCSRGKGHVAVAALHDSPAERPVREPHL